jgi:hypothetical protein
MQIEDIHVQTLCGCSHHVGLNTDSRSLNREFSKSSIANRLPTMEIFLRCDSFSLNKRQVADRWGTEAHDSIHCIAVCGGRE